MDFGQSEQARILQEDLTCPVCLDVYRNPHLLSCGHNFCQTCLDNVRRHAEEGRFRCPECRRSHRCSTPVQKNLKLASISDNYRQQQRGSAGARSADLEPVENLPSFQRLKISAVPCDYCPSRSASSGPAPACASQGDRAREGALAIAASGAAAPLTFAVKTCLKCEVSMCPEHVKPHLELLVFGEHCLTEPVKEIWKRKCPIHEEMYQYYCTDDKVFMCNTCTWGGHSGHAIRTMRNTMKDLKGSLDKELYRVERKYSMAEKKHREQKEKERQNKKYMEDCEGIVNGLCEDMKTAVLSFTGTLRECTRTYCNANGSAIEKNISRISRDQSRLQDARCGIQALMQENDPFRFIEAYRTTGKQCRRLLRRNMFYPEYVDVETEALGVEMEMEMREFLNEDLHSCISNAIGAICRASDAEEEEDEQEENEEELADEEDDNSDGVFNSGALEELSEGEDEEEEQQWGEGVGGVDLSDILFHFSSSEEENFEDAQEEPLCCEFCRRMLMFNTWNLPALELEQTSNR